MQLRWKETKSSKNTTKPRRNNKAKGRVPSKSKEAFEVWRREEVEADEALGDGEEEDPQERASEEQESAGEQVIKIRRPKKVDQDASVAKHGGSFKGHKQDMAV